MNKFKSLFMFALAASFIMTSCSDDEPTGPVESNDNIIVTGLITTDETWTADNVYELAGRVVVDSLVTLSIEPGTIIKGREGTGSLASALIVARGGKLMAEGTASQPIIFTSVLDQIEPGQTESTLEVGDIGKWGGLIVLGSATSSTNAVPEQIEGIPADDSFGRYGAINPNDADNSGVIEYVSIRFGGSLIGQGNEINGLTLGGVGTGTTINHVEVVGNKDDGIECFGGTVNISNALVWGQGDDAFDIDQAYSGTIDNFVYIAGSSSDHGMEVDGPEGQINGKFTMMNGTMKGQVGEYADFRDGAMGTVKNVYWFGFPSDADVELDEDMASDNFKNGDLVFEGWEFETTRALDAIFFDKSNNGGAFTTIAPSTFATTGVAKADATVGANTSEFNWTWAASKGQLDEF